MVNHKDKESSPPRLKGRKGKQLIKGVNSHLENRPCRRANFRYLHRISDTFRYHCDQATVMAYPNTLIVLNHLFCTVPEQGLSATLYQRQDEKLRVIIFWVSHAVGCQKGTIIFIPANMKV